MWCGHRACLESKESFLAQDTLDWHTRLCHSDELNGPSHTPPAPATQTQDQERADEEDDDITGTCASFVHEGAYGTKANVVIQQDYMAGLFGFSGHVCESSKRLSRFLLSNAFPEGFLKGKRCLELGAGCGLASMMLVLCHANVTVTDMEPSLPHLTSQLRANLTEAKLKNQARVLALDWTDEEQIKNTLKDEHGDAVEYDVIVASDCVYEHSMVDLLLSTMQALSGKNTLIVYTGLPINLRRGARLDGIHDAVSCWLSRVQQSFTGLLAMESNADSSQTLYTHGVWLLQRRAAAANGTDEHLQCAVTSQLLLTPRAAFH